MSLVPDISSQGDFSAAHARAGSKLVVVDYHAEWCGPCKQIAPIYLSIAKQYSGKAFFYRCDVDKAKDVAVSQQISAMPTFKFYVKGNVVGSVQGANPESLRKTTEELVSKHGGLSAMSGKGHSLVGSSSVASKQASTATPTAGPRRPNPWADPSFVPPGMRAESKQPEQPSPVGKTSKAKSSLAASSNANEDAELARAIALSMTETSVMPPTNDPSLLKNIDNKIRLELEDMGFSKIRVEKALILAQPNNDLEAATNWLVEHEADADIDEPLQIVTVPTGNVRGAPLGYKPGVEYEDDDGLSSAMRALKEKSVKEKAELKKMTGPLDKPMSEMTKDEKLAHLEKLKSSRREQKAVQAQLAAKERDAEKRLSAKSAAEAKRLREEHQAKLAADRIKREKEADKLRRKKIEEKIRLDKEARIRARQEKEAAKLNQS